MVAFGRPFVTFGQEMLDAAPIQEYDSMLGRPPPSKRWLS